MAKPSGAPQAPSRIEDARDGPRLDGFHLADEPSQNEGDETMGKFDSLKDEVIYRATLDGSCETVGDVQFGFHASKLVDFYGWDYIVIENEQGFVTVERYADIDIDGGTGGGYFSPTERRWAELVELAYEGYEDDED